jgi:vacuolar-type H+-ATPase subunit E/Vma4
METELAKITSIIVEEAKKEADLVIQEAQRQSDMLIKDKRLQAVKAAEEESSRLLRRLEEARLKKEREVADAKLKANWEVLEERHQLVNEALEGLKKELQIYVTSSAYINMLNELITTAGQVLQGGELVVVLNEEDSNKINLSELSKRITSETGVETELVLSEERHIDHGVIVKTKNGNIVVDNLLSSILERMEDELRHKAAGIIFDKNIFTLATA